MSHNAGLWAEQAVQLHWVASSMGTASKGCPATWKPVQPFARGTLQGQGVGRAGSLLTVLTALALRHHVQLLQPLVSCDDSCHSACQNSHCQHLLGRVGQLPHHLLGLAAQQPPGSPPPLWGSAGI